MRDNSFDKTIERNYIQKWRFLIPEYKEVKEGRHKTFKTVGAFYRHHGTCSQTFRKYYNRYLRSGREDDLLPRRRGAKWRGKREPEGIDLEIIAARNRGLNRYDIFALLKERHKNPPSPSTIYRRLRHHGLNRRTKPMIEEKRRIIKERLGELGHIDLHQVPQDIFLKAPPKPAFIVSVIDSCSRLAWAGTLTSKKALPVMFKTLRLLQTLSAEYGLKFEELLTDNGAEFASRNHPEDHPFEAMLLEMGIKHRYTRPYRPQTNGKIERFWRTLNEDVIDGSTFDDFDHFSNEIFEYMIYYNNHRPHQALNGLTPKALAQSKAIQNPSAN